MTHILLTNDDGYQAAGLLALAQIFQNVATVSIVAPSTEQSGAAQSLTLRQPIVCNKIADRQWAIDGTPADCVIVPTYQARRGHPVLFPWSMAGELALLKSDEGVNALVNRAAVVEVEFPVSPEKMADVDTPMSQFRTKLLTHVAKEIAYKFLPHQKSDLIDVD